MTLATIPRYESDRVSTVGKHAVVVGGSMAGLFAARVLADGFEQVTVIERDPTPSEPVARRGVPQGRQPHVLWEAGRATLEDLFPGYGEDLMAAGGLLLDATSDINSYFQGDFLAPGTQAVPIYNATRPLFEQVVRQHVSNLKRVDVRSGYQFSEYLLNDTATTVTGVVVREAGDDKAQEELDTDLVVDASGRASRTPRWLKLHGYTPPTVDVVNINLVYSSTLIERPDNDHWAIAVLAEAPRTRGSLVFPVEDGRWFVNLHGVHGDHPPTDPEGFKEFAASLPTPEVKQLLDDHPQVAEEIHRYPFPASRRHRYEDLDRFPNGLVVIGDAIASFNPIYGQGMSVAALEALVLHHTLASSSHENLALDFFDRATAVIDPAWALAVGADAGFPQTEGPIPRGTAFFSWYLARLFRRAHTDGMLTDAFGRVVSLQKPPTSLLAPRVMWRVLGPTG